MAETSRNSTTEQPSFEDALSTLEQIVRDLEEGRLGLAESLARYEEGVKLLKQCHTLLEHAQRRIELVTGVDAAGNPVTAPFDDTATADCGDDEAPRSRRGGKATKKAIPPSIADDSAVPEAGTETSLPAVDEPGSLF